MLERLLKYPGFIYHVGKTDYYLGKWICRECTDINATDYIVMYDMCRNAGEDEETGMYFHKIRACCDFALEIPYNPAKIRREMETLITGLSENERTLLEQQLMRFEEDFPRYCGVLS